MIKKLITILAVALLALSTNAQTTIYVDKDATSGANNGTSWTDAYTSFQMALDSAGTTDEIWVAEGTYLPTDSVDNSPAGDLRNRSFHATGKNIKIYGGFDGTETTLGDRDLANHHTIFSGDFNGDDVVTGSGATLTFSNNTENAYHVFVLTAIPDSSYFDGVTIQGGNADGGSGNYNYGGQNVEFNYGGGIYSRSSSSATVYSTVTVRNSTINSNNANSDGGGIYSNSTSSSSGTYAYCYSTVTVTNSTISGNNTSSNGGGVYSSSFCSSSPYFYAPNSTVAVSNSTITGNNASFNGGGIYSSSSNTGGMAGDVNSTVEVSNSTISYNNASSNGEGIYSYSNGGSASSKVTTKGSIVWSSNSSNIFHSGNAGVTNTSNGYNIFSDNFGGGSVGSDSINVSAASLNLLPLAYNGGNTQTMLPGSGSIAINSGDPSDNSDAQNRPIVGVRDRGAAESFCETPISETETSCGSFTWIDGFTYASDTSGVEYIIYSTDPLVCDSVFTLNLTVTYLAGDVNNDCIISNGEIAGDTDGNGTIDNGEIAGDIDGNGTIDNGEIAGDTDGNGAIDNGEIAGDTDGNGAIDNGEIAGDTGGNEAIDNGEIAGDTDGNGAIDNGEIAGDTDGNGAIDNGEIAGDTDGNGAIDNGEIAGDTDGNGVIDGGEVSGDENGNGVIDDNEELAVISVQYENLSAKVYPNPANNYFVIEITQSGIYTIELLDATGKVVLRDNFVGSKQTLNTSNLQNGVYLLSLQGEVVNKTMKIIINK